MKKGKRFIAAALLLTAALSLAACGKKQQCDLCGETKSGKTHTILGEKVFICNDCYDEMNSLMGK